MAFSTPMLPGVNTASPFTETKRRLRIASTESRSRFRLWIRDQSVSGQELLMESANDEEQDGADEAYRHVSDCGRRCRCSLRGRVGLTIRHILRTRL